jgi:hypothetical protein
VREHPAWTKAPGRWQDDLYDLLRRHNVTQFAYVPDAGGRAKTPIKRWNTS